MSASNLNLKNLENKCQQMKMCGTGDSGIIKSRTHELILFNVTYENVKISYTFMVNVYYM
jgi:hypothetical protein